MRAAGVVAFKLLFMVVAGCRARPPGRPAAPASPAGASSSRRTARSSREQAPPRESSSSCANGSAPRACEVEGHERRPQRLLQAHAPASGPPLSGRLRLSAPLSV
eukprot:CAMPEP_0204212660 /NCGR_PEP_ID=MMETSP0361-20130328/75401_1 /ASSEMBLY_ACC=CAM_ASM_000343 /TAXON_ID=268821 /ORGANISM="Scrippsiella Hangoei, Strain SHTV-5" /LENGTH=104 /DNA_ID=CAMNT_0051177015 /DNA_START=121 /DNA_END=435 /DNA_ORIENTATION=-